MKVGLQGFGIALLASLVFTSVTSMNVPPATAGISGSAHDFSGKNITDLRSGSSRPIDPNGTCSACHVAHGAFDVTGVDKPFKALPSSYSSLLWPRNLIDEGDYFNQYDSDPVYLRDPTLMCYDCHENQADEVDSIDDPSDWPLSSIQTDPTGGHYWKSDPDNSLPRYVQGDKLGCAICHDPHNAITGTNDVMFRTYAPAGGGTTVSLLDHEPGGGHTASTNTRARATLDAATYNGRTMCVDCHGWSDFGSPEEMWGVTLPQPSTLISQHKQSNDTACTDCHKHNKISFKCDECHGFPPMVAAPHDPDTEPNGYSADYTPVIGARSAEVHARHQDALGTTVFQCEICHGPDPGTASWHDKGTDDDDPNPGDVDIMGESSWWDPGDSRGAGATGYVGAASSETLPSGYEFTAKGGQDGADGGRCFGFACHGDPPNSVGALNWTDDMVNDTTGAAVTIEICEWCHDASPAVLDLGLGAVGAPNMMGDGSNFGSRVNGHSLTSGQYEGDSVGEGSRTGLAAANKECTICHDATYTDGVGPDKAHFDEAYGSTEKRLNAIINAQAVTDSDGTCVACHQNAGADAGAQLSSHGNTPTPVGYTQLEGNFQRRCRHCHEPHGLNWNGTGRNLHMIGKWLDNNAVGVWGTPEAGEEARVDSDAVGVSPAVNITVADNAVIFTSRTGANSFNDTGGTPSDDICQTCHSGGTGGGDHAGTTGYGGDERGNDCTTCHDHDYDDTVVTYIYDAFLPFGAPDIEQFFDGVATGGSYNDVSAHPLNLSEAPLSIPEAPNCIGCHKIIGGGSTSNECLKCHYEGYVTGGVWTWAGHADGNHTLELRTANSTYPYTAACNPGTNCISTAVQSTTAAVVDHCLLCHDGARTTAPYQLDSNNPPDVVPASSSWTGGFGHGSSTTLSSERTTDGYDAGPPAYDCRACHFSTVPDETDDPWPGFHASINNKLVANTTDPYQTAEYTDWSTGQDWCLQICHRTVGAGTQTNPDNSVAKDDNVLDHTWAPDDSESAYQTDCPLYDSGSYKDPTANVCETHPSWATIDDTSSLYQLPSTLPFDTGSDQFFCITCHEPHGDSTATEGQMIRLDYTDSTLCDECHQ
jgi:hypothetical protein